MHIYIYIKENLDLQKETETLASFYSDGANTALSYVSSHANLVDGRLDTVITGMNASNGMNSLLLLNPCGCLKCAEPAH